jgi:hypothetical protein
VGAEHDCAIFAREHRPRWEKSRGSTTNSSEQLRGLWGNAWRNKGMGRVLTSSVNFGTLGEQRGVMEPRVDGSGAPVAQETLR